MADRSTSLMERWLISFPRPTVHVRKFSKRRPTIMHSIVDGLGQTDDRLRTSSRFPPLVERGFGAARHAGHVPRRDAPSSTSPLRESLAPSPSAPIRDLRNVVSISATPHKDDGRAPAKQTRCQLCLMDSGRKDVDGPTAAAGRRRPPGHCQNGPAGTCKLL